MDVVVNVLAGPEISGGNDVALRSRQRRNVAVAASCHCFFAFSLSKRVSVRQNEREGKQNRVFFNKIKVCALLCFFGFLLCVNVTYIIYLFCRVKFFQKDDDWVDSRGNRYFWAEVKFKVNGICHADAFWFRARLLKAQATAKITCWKFSLLLLF